VGEWGTGRVGDWEKEIIGSSPPISTRYLSLTLENS
jgi:hypothetical protein